MTIAERGSSEAPWPARHEVLRLLQLGEDLLWEIVSILPVSDAYVLSVQGDKLARFTSYVLAEPEKRLRWVRALVVLINFLDIGSQSTNGLDALVVMLRAVRKYYLTSFTLKVSGSDWVGMETWLNSFCVALSELLSLANLDLSLQHIHISRQRPLWQGLQGTFFTGLRSLDLNILPVMDEPEHTLALFRQMHSLQQLENLNLSNLNMLSPLGNYDGFSWPTLRTLEVAGGIVSLSALSRMFPAVRTVKTSFVKPDHAATSVDIARWQCLDRLSVNKDDSTLAAVHCPVRILEVRCRSFFTGFSMTNLVPHIYDLRPIALRLSSCLLDNIDDWRALVDALAAVGTRHLQLEFRVPSEVSGRILNWANNMSRSLARTSLIVIKIIASSTSRKALVREVQLEADAGKILAIAVPTLQCAAVKHRSLAMADVGVQETWWTFERESDAINMSTIQKEEGERLVHEILKRLELGLQNSRS